MFVVSIVMKSWFRAVAAAFADEGELLARNTNWRISTIL